MDDAVALFATNQKPVEELYDLQSDPHEIDNLATRPEFAAPSLWWTPVIAPAGLAFYVGDDFPDWRGHMLIGALRGQGLVLVAGDGSDQLARWDLRMRVRDVAVARAGHVWLIEDSGSGGLYRLVPR